MDPVPIAVGHLDDQRVLDGANVLEFDPSRNPGSDDDALRFELESVGGPNANESPRRDVDDAQWALHMRVRSVRLLRGHGVAVMAMLSIFAPIQHPGRVLNLDPFQ